MSRDLYIGGNRRLVDDGAANDDILAAHDFAAEGVASPDVRRIESGELKKGVLAARPVPAKICP